MVRWIRRHRPTRTVLKERKRQLEGEINALVAEIRRLERRGEQTASAEARLGRLRDLHYRTRLEIDRADPST